MGAQKNHACTRPARRHPHSTNHGQQNTSFSALPWERNHCQVNKQTNVYRSWKATGGFCKREKKTLRQIKKGNPPQMVTLPPRTDFSSSNAKSLHSAVKAKKAGKENRQNHSRDPSIDRIRPRKEREKRGMHSAKGH